MRRDPWQVGAGVEKRGEGVEGVPGRTPQTGQPPLQTSLLLPGPQRTLPNCVPSWFSEAPIWREGGFCFPDGEGGRWVAVARAGGPYQVVAVAVVGFLPALVIAGEFVPEHLPVRGEGLA